jgi:K+-sensing histidine kinase KdpD
MLTVRDSGHGIDPTIINKIFEPYFTTKDKGKGTGLGLSVVHGIVRNCGGTVTVSSELSKGTTFQIYIPAIPEEINPGEKAEYTPDNRNENIILNTNKKKEGKKNEKKSLYS